MYINWRLGVICGVALLLGGCGHGDGDGESSAPAELRGVFQAGNVSRVRFSTPTRTGLTDGSGTFKYLPGETVAFSIGGIKLGTVPGAPVVTPFTLAGMTPPTTESALRLELDRAIRTTSSFVRAINIQRLLLALDADNDPANGLDMRGRETTLAAATLSFDLPTAQFGARLDALAPDLTHNMPRWYPIVHLYRALGIAVPAHAPVRYVSDDVMFFTRNSVVSYYPDGSRESDGSSDASAAIVYSTGYGYDSLGRTKLRRTLSQPSSQTGFVDEERWSFDARGTLTGSFRERDEGADGVIEYSGSVDYEIDAFNNLLHQVTRNDIGNDGSVDGTQDYRATYDAAFKPLGNTWETDEDADGTIDSRSTHVYEYDSSNRLITQRAEWDAQADDIVDSRETWSISYATAGPGAVEVYERDDGADGVPDVRLTYRWSFEASGALRTREELQEYDSDANGVMDSSSTLTVTYDDDARVLTEVGTQNAVFYTGVPVNTRRTFTYADHGGPLRVATETDVGADGEVDARYAVEYEYGSGGELLNIRNTSDPFLLGPVSPGVPTALGVTQVTNVPMADGVLMLSQQYFEFWYSLGQIAP